MRRPCCRTRGLTMIELLVTIAIAAILLGIAVPGFSDLLERRRVEGVTNELSGDLQFARTESVSRKLDVALATASDGASYTVSTSTGVSLKSVTLPPGITTTASKTLTYTALRGIPNETSTGDLSIDISSTKTAGTLRVVNNFMGRLQLCSPSGTLKGYPTC